MKPSIRFRKTKDMDLIKKLDLQLIGEASPPKECHYWWIAYVNGEVAGYCGLGVFTAEGGYGFLSRSGVLRPFRGQGIQKRMLKLRERAAKKMKIPLLITYTSGDNHASANSLIRCGYTLYSPAYAYGVEGALYFRKSLLNPPKFCDPPRRKPSTTK